MKNGLLLAIGIVGCLAIAMGFYLVFSVPAPIDQAEFHKLLALTFIFSGFALLGGAAHALSRPLRRAR